MGFWLMLLFLIFISSYTTIYFSKENYFLECLYFSEYDIRMPLYVFWLRKELSVKYIHNWLVDEGSSKMRTAAYKGRGCHALCVRTHLHYLFPCFRQHFCLTVSSFICRNLNLPLFKKDVFFRNGYFYLTRSISVVMIWAFFS